MLKKIRTDINMNHYAIRPDPIRSDPFASLGSVLTSKYARTVYDRPNAADG